jgi:hypothetical protein
MSVSGRGASAGTSTHPFHPGRLSTGNSSGRERRLVVGETSPRRVSGAEEARWYIRAAGIGAGVRACLIGCRGGAGRGVGHRAVAGRGDIAGEEVGGEVGSEETEEGGGKAAADGKEEIGVGTEDDDSAT